MTTAEADYNTEYDYEYNLSSPCSTDPSSSNGSSFQPILFYVVFSLGLPGNSMTLWVLLKYIKLKSMTDVCLLNLALSDLLLVLSLPLWGYYSQGHEPEGDSPCKVMTVVYQVGFYSGTLFVTLMSVDRYLAIVHAVSAMRARTLRYGAVASILIWLASIGAALPDAIFVGVWEEDGRSSCQKMYPENTEKTWKLFQNFVENVVGLFLCLPVMGFCYISILVVLKRSRNSKKGRAMKLILAIVCVFVVCWVPYNIVVFLKTLQMFDINNSNCEVSLQVDTALKVTEAIALAHCCINPVIYAFVGEKFRMHLRNMISRYPLCKHLNRHTVIHSKTSENETSNTTA